MARITESEVEDAALQWLAGLGYVVAYGLDIGPEGPAQERGSYDEVLLADRLRKALARLKMACLRVQDGIDGNSVPPRVPRSRHRRRLRCASGWAQHPET